MGQKDPMPWKISPLTGLAKYNPIEAAVIALGKASDAANVVTGSGMWFFVRDTFYPRGRQRHFRGRPVADIFLDVARRVLAAS